MTLPAPPFKAQAYIAAVGLVSPLGQGASQNGHALAARQGGLHPLSCFPTPDAPPLPAGQFRETLDEGAPTRTHALARLACHQIDEVLDAAPDAIVLGTTTGGMARTEDLLSRGNSDPAQYVYHGVGTVAEDLGRRYGCQGPLITVSTACSSGAVAIGLALELIRSGRAQKVLAGGVDCLCRLTYYGFRSLLLIDPQGARPLDPGRKGMSVGEGAGLLLLTADPPQSPVGAILGVGLSCDASHPTQPHPKGAGALKAMERALADAGLQPGQVDYVNLHGTGTADNDLSEARALQRLYKGPTPPVSSVKGAWGHPLAAAGAMEAALATHSLDTGKIPPTVGLADPDPQLELTHPSSFEPVEINHILSNSFGFGGNNASVVIGKPNTEAPHSPPSPMELEILEWGCITGAGFTAATLDRIYQGKPVNGCLPARDVAADLNPRQIRRLKRLTCLALALASETGRASGETSLEGIFLGTGWGAMSETHSFLHRLFETGCAFPSPTDFVGSVHNAPAGQVAIHHGATGANVTTSGGDTSFEQALMAAELMAGREPGVCLLLGADEAHTTFTPLFDLSGSPGTPTADGGGALRVRATNTPGGAVIRCRFFQGTGNTPEALDGLKDRLTQDGPLADRYGVILVGIPAAEQSRGDEQWKTIESLSGVAGIPKISYRQFTGEFATAAAVAAVLAADLVHGETLPPPLAQGKRADLGGRGALILGLGACLTAIEIIHP
jgi:3-oxoacyl-[acyl-carrier-protein] synthase-1/3-oxoacyl-[acyl-carrier-protein] synthase II